MKKYTFPILLIWLFVVCLLAGCKREEAQPAVDGSPLSVPEAREWFEGQTSAAAGKKTGNLPARVPQWAAAQQIKLSDGVPAIAVPVQYKEKGLGTGGLARLLFFVKQGQLQMRVMKMVSDSAYFYRNNQQIKLENFSGVLTMHDWEERFLYGARYEGGKVTGRLSEPKSAGRIGPTCELVTITHFVKVCVGSECATNIDYVEQYMDCSGGGGGGEVPLPTGPLGGGGGGGGTPSEPRQPLTFSFLKPRGIIMPGLGLDPIDLARYLACFGEITDNATYQITVYVNEPVSGFGLSKFGTDVGHTFVGLKKQYPGTDTYIQQVFGFYPNASTADILSGTVPGEFSNNGGSGYTVSVTYDVSAGQFQNALNAAAGMGSQSYNLMNQNCTDAAFTITNAAGLPVPQTSGAFPWGSGYGHSPGQLGLDLRNKPHGGTPNTNGGEAPMSMGPC